LSAWLKRTVPVSALNTEGCDHGWLFRLMRGSTGAGSTLPSRLKPFWLGWVLRLCSTSNSSTESRVMRQSAASENMLRLPSRLWCQWLEVFARHVEPVAELAVSPKRPPRSSAPSTLPRLVVSMRTVRRSCSVGRLTT
jgi:hypothetical protein